MTTITFDTLAYARRRRDVGMPEAQAEAQAAALADVLKVGAIELATKADLTELRQDLKNTESALRQELKNTESALRQDMGVLEERTEGRFKLLQWMLGFDLVDCRINSDRA